MNNRLLAAFFVSVLALTTSTLVRPTLFDRGGGMIYDDVLNITWLQDANYALTSGYPSWNGRMQFDEANAWAAQLVYGGYSDWRLPRVKPINGSTFTGPVFSYDGSTDYAYNISYPGRISPPDPPGAYPYSTQNEIAYMFYVNLGNLAKYRTDGTPRSGTSGIDFGMFQAPKAPEGASRCRALTSGLSGRSAIESSRALIRSRGSYGWGRGKSR